MSQQAKKPATPPQQQAAKVAAAASAASNKFASQAYSAAESTQKAAQNVVNISSSAVRDMFSSGTGEAQKAQEKIWEMGRENIENFARGADMFTRLCMEMISICRDNIEASIECATISASACKAISADLAETCNKSFSDCVELSKEAFTCRTVNDVADLQNKALKSAMDTCFAESSKISNYAFECASEALEPISERVCEASERLCKVMAA